MHKILLEDYMPLIVPNWDIYNKFRKEPIPVFMQEIVESSAFLFAHNVSIEAAVSGGHGILPY